MGLVRRALENTPLLRESAKILYRRPVEVPRALVICGAAGLAGFAAYRTEKGRKMCESLWRMGFKDHNQEKLPNQEEKEKKPTVFLDLEEVLIKKAWSIWHLGYKITVREHAEEFLFHLSNTYEVVCVSSLPPEISEEVFQKIDPYKCIKYRVFVQDSSKFSEENSNRSLNTVVRVRGTETDTPSQNEINIGKWNGDSEDKLLLVLDFLINLQQIELEDFRTVLRTYKEKSFSSEYKRIQKEIYPRPRKYLLFADEESDPVKKINKQRIEEYIDAKEYVENQLRIRGMGR